MTPLTETEVFPEHETALAAVELLAHWWSRPVPEEVAVWLAAADVEDEVQRRLLGRTGTESLARLACGELLVEYERLFVGPGPVPCPPYESFWREDVPIDVRRSLMGPCTADLRRLYGELGLEVVPERGELPDLVSIELEALAYAISCRNEPVAQELFMSHLKKWLPRLSRAVAREAEHTFYRELAQLSLAWVRPLEGHVVALAAQSGAP
jgi:putative dimethyl sulfoxide reductase chaperone